MKKGLILMATGVEECEALMVVDLVRRASLAMDMASISDDIYVVSAHNIELKCDVCLANVNVDDYDYLVVPGGKVGVDNLAASQLVSDTIAAFVNGNKLVAAICAGPSVISRLGYLDGKRYTVYPGFEGFGDKAIYTNTSCEVYGNFITSNGLGAQFAFVKAIIRAISDEQTANNVLASIQYKG